MTNNKHEQAHDICMECIKLNACCGKAYEFLGNIKEAQKNWSAASV